MAVGRHAAWEPLLPGSVLELRQPTLREARWELWSATGRVASIQLAGNRALAQTEGGRLRMDRDVSGVVRAWAVADGALVAELSRPTWRGTRAVRLASGAELAWEPASVWRLAWRFRRGPHEQLVSRRGRGILRTNGWMQVAPTADSTTAPLLAVLAAYLAVLGDRDSTVAAVAGVIPSI